MFSISPLIAVYLALLPLLVCLDLLWLGVFMRGFYQTNLGHLLAPHPAWPAAVVFYLLFTAGLVYFALAPAVISGSIVRAVLAGVAFALVAYGTYDLTNQATLRDWPLSVTLLDMAWGAFLGAVLSAAGFYLYGLFT